LLLCLFLLRFLQNGERLRDAAAAGLAAGLSALCLPLVLVVVPAVLVWFGWRRRLPAALFLAALALPVLPVTARNLRTGGEPVLISANGGINFYMGNNADLRHTADLRPGPEWRRMQELPMRQGIVAASARDRWFLRRGLRFWVESPGRALAQTLQKALLLVH